MLIDRSLIPGNSENLEINSEISGRTSGSPPVIRILSTPNSLKSLIVPALLGAVTGSLISSHLPAPILKRTFGIFLFVIACKFLVRGLVELPARIKTMKACEENG